MTPEADKSTSLSYVQVAEQKRLNEAREKGVPWKKWGPYLSERQWGTVREDYSRDGNAWDYFTHDQSRSRAYHWGEDGLAGYCDGKQLLCFALALWNGRDPILKERMFGLTNSESNHGEDVKEYYFYLDSTPTHSYMKYLYKYPQAEYPYHDLVETNRRRSREEFEYELLDTGIFDDDRYFDVFVEYAKVDPEDTLIRISVYNRGPEDAQIHVLPTLWFRNTWSWGEDETKPVLGQIAEDKIHASHPQLGEYTLQCDGAPELLFTENESNAFRLWGQPNPSPYVKDAFHQYVISGMQDAVNPARTGSKAAAHYVLEVPAGGSKVVRLRLSPKAMADGFGKLDQVFDDRLADAMGVVLPSGAQLKGGALSANLTIVGPLDKLVITGPVRLSNTQLANFDLGSKLGALSAFTGKAGSSRDTSIQNASLNARVAPEGTRADNINLTVADRQGIGSGNYRQRHEILERRRPQQKNVAGRERDRVARLQDT